MTHATPTKMMQVAYTQQLEDSVVQIGHVRIDAETSLFDDRVNDMAS